MTRQHNLPGLLIAIEGIDGAGKTTQAQLLEGLLQSRGYDVVRTKEPTNGKWGAMLRETAKSGRLPPEDELNAFVNDRKEHVETIILPNLQIGKIVIVDRYYFSTAAYQGARGMDVEKIIQINEQFAPEPDILILIDVEPELGIKRVKGRGKTNAFEKNGTLAKARAIFNQIEKPYLFKVDGNRGIEEIRDEVFRSVAIIMTNKIAERKNLSVEDKLNRTLNVFGGDPLPTDSKDSSS